MANSNFVVHNGLSVGALTIHASNGAVTTTGAISTSGGFDGVDATSIANGTSKVQVYGSTVIGFNVAGTANVVVIGTAGAVSLPSITKLGVNGTGDIGQTDNRFDSIYGVAVSAKYADLAEKYVADADIEPGTVVHFGGEHEVSTCDVDHCQAVAGVVSTDPAYRMNDALEAEHVAMVALTGRVPCKVTGTVAKGDMMVSAGNGRARAEANPKVGAVIGKALEASEGEAVIEVVVGKH
jgi:hypothetical protein